MTRQSPSLASTVVRRWFKMFPAAGEITGQEPILQCLPEAHSPRDVLLVVQTILPVMSLKRRFRPKTSSPRCSMRWGSIPKRRFTIVSAVPIPLVVSDWSETSFLRELRMSRIGVFDERARRK